MIRGSAALSCALAAITVSAPGTMRIASGAAGVPMLDFGGRPMVEITINGKGPYPVILDTGASFTGIDETLATELNLPPVDSVHGEPTVLISELAVGGVVVHDFRAGRMPSLLSGMGGEHPPRGVLSAATFPGRLVVLDYPRKRVSIEPGSLAPPDNRRIFEYGADEELPVIPVRVAGHEYRIHLDSGSPAGVMLPMKYIPELPLEAPPIDVGRARTVTGTFPVQAATVKGTIEIGEYTLPQKDVRFSDLRPGPAPGIGNLGGSVLRDFVVTLDSANRRVKLERP